VPSVSHARKGKFEGRGTVFGHAGGFGSVVEKSTPSRPHTLGVELRTDRKYSRLSSWYIHVVDGLVWTKDSLHTLKVLQNKYYVDCSERQPLASLEDGMIFQKEPPPNLTTPSPPSLSHAPLAPQYPA
jgi:hypothetical protein